MTRWGKCRLLMQWVKIYSTKARKYTNKAFPRQEAKLRAARPHSSLRMKYPERVTGWRREEECWLPELGEWRKQAQLWARVWGTGEVARLWWLYLVNQVKVQEVFRLKWWQQEISYHFSQWGVRRETYNWRDANSTHIPSQGTWWPTFTANWTALRITGT